MTETNDFTEALDQAFDASNETHKFIEHLNEQETAG